MLHIHYPTCRALSLGHWLFREFQFHHLLPEFSALENIVLPQLANGVSQKVAEARGRDLLARVGVAARADHRPAQLSGGEQQRVAFCRALANGPKLLLADEPTVNLDPRLAAEIMGVFEDINRLGTTVLIASHDLDLIRRMRKRVPTHPLHPPSSSVGGGKLLSDFFTEVDLVLKEVRSK